MQVRYQKDKNAKQWESGDFPILCEECLGENPYTRMSKGNIIIKLVLLKNDSLI